MNPKWKLALVLKAYFSIYMTFWVKQSYMDENPPVVGRDEGWRKGWPQKGSIREYFGVMKLWGILIIVVDTQFYVFVKSYRIMHKKVGFKYV